MEESLPKLLSQRFLGGAGEAHWCIAKATPGKLVGDHFQQINEVNNKIEPNALINALGSLLLCSCFTETATSNLHTRRD
ncbi:Uncharacterized protein DAT39_003193 [Clarias magur]|uniref:Uncharacterized protein n=1 Tax=Clarias magur TaxID=1594786 RepID=A0A8J4X9V4_CLAMG|nr:Uncharacterized protein DAT39_003193 [Clarias magur]